MIVRFTKAAPASSSDLVACIRDDGTESQSAMPRHGVLPHLAAHYVVETVLRFSEGVFGLVAGGRSFGDLARFESVSANDGLQLAQAATLVAVLRAEQWSGAASPEEFGRTLAGKCRQRGVEPPALSADAIEALRGTLRVFGASWRPLAPGRSLERRFPA